jgi:hypothetical protein
MPRRESLVLRRLEAERALGVRLVERVQGHEGRMAAQAGRELAPEGLGLALESRITPQPAIVHVSVELLPARSSAVPTG